MKKYDNQNIKSLIPSRKLLFNGSLGIEYINTKSHPKQELDIEGTIDVNNSVKK